MLEIGIQTRNVVMDENPAKGFEMIKKAGFQCCDFSLNNYLEKVLLDEYSLNDFFDKSERELEAFFTPHKEAAKKAGIRIHQMHMPYPVYLPKAGKEINDYLFHVVGPKSLAVCAFMECSYIVVHGFKLSYYLGSEEAEWARTEEFLDFLAPKAKALGITICLENLYTNVGNHIIEGPCCDARKAVTRIDRLNEKHGAEIFGFCFDIGHANLVSIDCEDFITVLGKRLKVLHVHDNDGVRDLHQIPFTFTRSRQNTSSTDWEGFIKGLQKVDFKGVLNFETAPTLDAFPEVLKQDVITFIAKVGRYLASEL